MYNCSNPFICCYYRPRCCCPNFVPIPGPVGPQGTAATISVGTTTTGAAGTQASVTNSGTSSNAVLNFVIPRGENGQAATINVGTTTTLPAGSNATVTNVGTSTNAILNFGIPGSTTIDSGSFISRTTQTYTTASSIILLPITLNSNNITIANGVISISKSGRYKIDYGVKATTSNNIVGLYINGTNNTNTNITTTENDSVSSSVILTLTNSDVITLGAVNASTTTPITLASDTINAYITITSLD